VRRRAAVLLLGLGALFLTPGASGLPNVPGDPTPPAITPVITGTLGSAGWYVTNVTVNWAVVDPESIILSTTGCNTITFTANTTGTQLTCSAESDGGTTTVSKTFRIDKTAPAASATPSRTADSNGWYNHDLTVAFAGTDATSGLESCSPPTDYAGPDTPGTTVAGTCRDRAGNVAPATFPLKYDETPPQASAAARSPDANGWHNHALPITFQGADGTSGVDTCTQTTYAGPDDPSVVLAGTCRDRAGNASASAPFTFKYDETPPQASATASRVPDANGWYNHPLTVTFAGTDATSGLDSCDPAKAYSGPDGASVSVSGSCRDLAGNVAPRAVVVKYDASAPQVGATPARGPNANGWYSAPVSVTFAGADPMSGVSSCVAPKSYGGPDSGAASVTGSCSDQAGNVGIVSFPLRYDATAPQANASPARPADANGWYNHPLAVTFAGTDATSGIASCDAAKTYSAPDSASVSLSGGCVDRAGNQTASAAFGFKYDATAPQASATPARQPNAHGWYRTPVSVAFSATDTLSGFDTCNPATTYSGPDAGGATVTGTCRDRAGNVGAASFALRYDATAPLTTATPSRQPNSNGWYNAPLTVGFAATDSLSGVDSCEAARTYSGPDVASGALTGTCLDKAGNPGVASFPLRFDATPPAATATPTPAANANGWHNAPLTVGFTATDALSGVDSCDAAKGYAGPDASSAAVSGACRDKAGNPATASATLRYDATPPSTTATPSRQPNANGWYRAAVSVSFAATDTTSTVDSCEATKTYAGPDVASVAVSGTCRDKAGNVAAGSATMKYDATAPTASATASRPPNAAGWYNAPLSVSFSATDATSGLDSCPAAQPYSGPDGAFAVASGTCLDKAGNGAAASLALKYDETAPDAAGAPSRPPDANGWYNRPLAVGFQGTDLTSGIASCTAPTTYAGPDVGAVSLSGSCRDVAGNESGSGAFAFKYDAGAPATTATTARGPDANGWYNHAISVSFAGIDAVSGVASCDPPQSYDGPDSTLAVVGGVCLDNAGNAGLASVALSYDATVPHVTGASPSRPPDANGWYNRPLTIGFHGSDATSGTAACTQASYAGPDAAEASVTGSCRDHAGNASAAASFTLRFDGTAPSLTNVRAKAGNRTAELTWTASPDTTLVEIRRGGKVVYRGTGRRFVDTRLENGLRYRYTVTASDEAANGATGAVTARPTAPLVSPSAGAVVSASPRLVWVAVEKATYYNVQLWRGGKILSRWPKATSMRVPRSWVYRGRRYRLTPGRYRWYVWPGYGRRAEKRFGRLLGASSFVVR
jgi:hypothetical protein